MKTKHKTLEFQTKGEFDFIDITEQVKSLAKESGVQNGLVNIQTLHTTAAVIVNEKEPLLLEDLKRHLENLSPKSLKYSHDNLEIRTVNVCEDECINGHSHCKAVLLPISATLNIINGEIQFGQWQSVLFLELDRSRKRKVQIQIIGE